MNTLETTLGRGYSIVIEDILVQKLFVRTLEHFAEDGS